MPLRDVVRPSFAKVFQARFHGFACGACWVIGLDWCGLWDINVPNARAFMSQNDICFEIGARIRELRGDLSQDAFAQRLKVNRKTVTRWEAGTAIPDGASLLALLVEFGADPKWLLTGQRSRSDLMKLTHREMALLDNYEHADAEGKKIIEGTALLASKPQGVKGKKTA